MDGLTIRLVDVAAEAREMYGDNADYIAGRTLPEHEWRFEVTTGSGARCSFHLGATAEHIAAYLAERGDI